MPSRPVWSYVDTYFDVCCCPFTGAFVYLSQTWLDELMLLPSCLTDLDMADMIAPFTILGDMEEPSGVNTYRCLRSCPGTWNDDQRVFRL